MSRLGRTTLVYCTEKEKMVPKGTEAQAKRTHGATHHFTVKEYGHISRSLPAKGWGYDHEVSWNKWAQDPNSKMKMIRPYFESRRDVDEFNAANPAYAWDPR